MGEESPGSAERGCRLTAGEGDFKDSATENKRLFVKEYFGYIAVRDMPSRCSFIHVCGCIGSFVLTDVYMQSVLFGIPENIFKCNSDNFSDIIFIYCHEKFEALFLEI